MGQTHPFPEPESRDLDRFMIISRVEILAMLRQLVDSSNLITCYFDRHAGFVVTTLLAVNPEFEELVLGMPSDADAMRRLLAADELVFVTFVGQIKVQFRAKKADSTLHHEKPAFRVRLPRDLLRLQRRDFFRVNSLLTQPAVCLVPYPMVQAGKEAPTTYEKLKVLNLSVGGVAVLTHPDRLALRIGQTLRDCYLDLPGIGQVAISLTVKHLDAVPKNPAARCCGCEIVLMPPQARMMLQRYINKIDLEQRKSPTLA